MSKYIITSDNDIINKQVIIINGEDSCEIIDNELVIHNALKLKQFISMNTIILIKYNHNLYLIPDFILMFMKNDTTDNNLVVSYLIKCSFINFMNKVKDKSIDINDFNTLFKNKEDTINDYSDLDDYNNYSICYCSIM